MAIADDAQLVKLAAHRARDLFPILKRARTLTPLLVLFAILPGLSGLTQHKFSEDGALWGLKSLDAFTSTEIMEFVDPGRTGSAEILKSQPPLGSWLTASVISLVGLRSPYAFTLISFLSTAGLVTMSFILMQILHGSRAGFLTASILAFHGPFLELTGTPAPHAIALLLAVVSFWGLVVHFRNSVAVVSFPLLIAGIALGLCFLSGGLLGFAMIVVLLAYALTLKQNVIPGKSYPLNPQKRRRVWTRWIALRSLCIVLLTTFAIAGWWFLMMWSRDGTDFFSDWLAINRLGNFSFSGQELTEIPSSSAGFVIHQIVSMLGLIVGLSLFGFWRALREVFRGGDEQKRPGCLFLLVWTGTAAVVFLGLLWESNGNADHLTLYKGFLLLPLIALAAFAIDEIAERRVDVRVVTSILFVTIAALTGKYHIVEIENGNIQNAAWLLMILFAFATLFVWQVGLICTENDSRHRLVIGSVIVVLIAFNSVSGLSSFRKEDPVNRELTALRNELTQNDDENFKSTLIIQSETPFRLHFLLRSLYPNADFQIVTNWDAVISQATAGRSESAAKRLIVNWNPQERSTGTISIPGSETTEIILQQESHPRRLRAYVVTPSTEYQHE